MMSLLSRLALTDEQRVAVNQWKYAQRRVKDCSGPLGRGFVTPELWQQWNTAMRAVYAVALDPQDYLRSKK